MDEPGEVVWMVPDDLIEDVRTWAKERGLSLSEALRELVRIGLTDQRGRLSS